MKLMLNPSPRPAVLPTRASRYRTGLLTGLLLLGTTLVGTALAQSTTAVPKFLSYQGKVTDASGTPIGDSSPVNRTVIFRIWSDATGVAPADLVYSEQQTVTISNGEFSALIGQGAAVSGTPLGFSEDAVGEPNLSVDAASVFSGAARYLGVTIDDGSGNPDAEISPRQRLVTSAYAMRSKVAESLSTGATDALRVADDGKVGVGVTSPSANLHVQGDIRSGAAGTQAPQVTLMASSDTIVALTMGYANGNGAFSTAAAGGDSVIRTDNNGKLILQSGTVGPAMVIDASNNITATNTVTSSAINVQDNSLTAHAYGAWLEWNKQGNTGTTYLLNQKGAGTGGIVFGEVDTANSWTEHMVISGTGSVGIGTDPGAKLHISDPTDPNILLSHSGGGTQMGLFLGGTGYGIGRQNDDLYMLPGSGNIYFGGWGSTKLNYLGGTGRLGLGTTGPGGQLGIDLGQFGHTAAMAFTSPSGTSNLTFHVGDIFGDTTSPNVAMFDWAGTAGTLGIRENLSVLGRLAIGNNAPAAGLSVRANGTTKAAEFVTGDGSSTIFNVHVGELPNGVTGPKTVMFDIVGTGVVSVWDNFSVYGNIGIGRWNPDVPLHIATTTQQYLGSYYYLNGSTTGNGGNVTTGVSIWASGRVVSEAEFNVVSDERVKIIEGRSLGADDLETLMEVEVTDYQYVDSIAYSDRSEKKVIAQQVESVYPSAVSVSTGVIPDIFETATVAEDWIQLETDLSVGDRVRMITGSEDDSVFEVLETRGDAFRVELGEDVTQVFVYGREVDDLRTIDYDALAMLNISATQEIKRQKDAEVAALTDIVEDLLERVAELEAKLGEK